MTRQLTDAEHTQMIAELDAVHEETPDEAQCAINQILIRWGHLERCPGDPPCATCPTTRGDHD